VTCSMASRPAGTATVDSATSRTGGRRCERTNSGSTSGNLRVATLAACTLSHPRRPQPAVGQSSALRFATGGGHRGNHGSHLTDSCAGAANDDPADVTRGTPGRRLLARCF
jgi:hypothetical protein